VSQGLTTDEGVIAPIEPGVTIDFGKHLDMDIDFIQKSQNTNIPFIDSEDDFVNTGLKIVFNGVDGFVDPYVRWLDESGGHISLWADNMKSLVSLYRLEHEMTGANTFMTADNILQLQGEVLNMLKLSPDMHGLLQTLKRDSLYPIDMLTNMLLVWDYTAVPQKLSDVWGLYDFPVRLMDTEQLGAVYDAKIAGNGAPVPFRFSTTVAGLMYYKARSVENRGASVLPFNGALDKYLDAAVSGFVKGEVAAITAFQTSTTAYLNKVAAEPADQRPRADLTLYKSIQAPLLTPTIIPDFDFTLRDFNRNTNSCLTSDKPCLDFKQ
jgi:hypothetical protein